MTNNKPLHVLISPTEAAELVSVPRPRIYGWIKEGRLAAYRIRSRTIRLDPAEVERAAEQLLKPRRSRTEPSVAGAPAATRSAGRPPRPTATEVSAWVDSYYESTGRIPTRDEIWRAFDGLTKLDAEKQRREGRARRWHPEP